MIRVLIAEPYRVTRDCLKRVLEREKDIELLGEADSLDKAVVLAREQNPEVVLLDYDGNQPNGMDTLRKIVFQPTKPSVIVLMPLKDLAMRREFVKVGVKGCYCWQDPLEEILAAIRAVHAGHTYLSSQVAGRVPIQQFGIDRA